MGRNENSQAWLLAVVSEAMHKAGAWETDRRMSLPKHRGRRGEAESPSFLWWLVSHQAFLQLKLFHFLKHLISDQRLKAYFLFCRNVYAAAKDPANIGLDKHGGSSEDPVNERIFPREIWKCKSKVCFMFKVEPFYWTKTPFRASKNN